ncbi:MAG: ABC transporter substrate-binding protein, partial [Prevotella sp.]|nr:ABC transporter substrate-binding protein [Prevotella sp.]
MRTSYLFVLPVILYLSSCGGSDRKKSHTDAVRQYDIKYAAGFDIAEYAGYTEVRVYNPWDSASVLCNYILVEKGRELPPNLPEGQLIRTPLENIIASSSIYCTILQELNMLPVITGVCEPEHISVEYIIQGIKTGAIADLGQTSNPDIEKIILLDPEAIMIAPIQGMAYGAIEKTRVPLIETPDYLEATPLGRAEWLKFYAAFVGKEHTADSLFAEVEQKYNAIKGKSAAVTNRPTVFNDTKYGNVWYMPGGKSYMANLMKDAGASYLWADDDATGSTPLSFETVLDKAEKAQYWLIKYNNKSADMTYNILEKEFKPYSYFDAFKNRNTYGCNTGKVSYYEDLPVHPEYVLQDLA